MDRKPEHLFDVRTLQRNLADGLVTEEEVRQWLASLPDDAGNAEETTTRMVASTAPSDEDASR